MASVTDAIRRLVIQASAPGAAQATAELQALAAAQGGVAVASATAERATTSLDSKFASMERRYNTALRNQQDYAKIQTQVNAAVAQNPALQDRANAVLAAAADRYGQVTGAQKAFGVASQTVNLQVAALASGLGLTGQILSALGPWGFAAAVGLGAVQSALSLASEKSHELAQKAKEISEFSEATGLTTTQFQALRSEAGKFGIDSEALASGLTKFTAGFENLRNGSGELLTQIRRVNPAIADQMQATTDAATAFTLFGKAVDQTNNIFQRNALLKAGMGKGAATFGAFFESSPDVTALGVAAAAAGKGIDANLIDKLKQLQISIDKTKSAANTVFATMFGTSTLEAELEFQKGILEIAKAIKAFEFSDDFKKLINFLTDPRTLLAAGALATAAAALSGGTLLAVAGVGLAGAGVYGAANQEIRGQGRSAMTAASLPPAPNFDATFSAAAKAATLTQSNIDTKKYEAVTADLEKTVAMLGSAATASEKYDLALRKLNQGQEGLVLTGEKYNRAVAALDLDRAIAQQNAHNTALGASTPIADLVIAKTQQLLKLQQEGARLTPAQIKFQTDLYAAQQLGTFQIGAMTKAEQVHIATLGMTTEQGLAYSIVQTKINEGLALGNPLTDDQIAKLQKSADAYAKVKVAGDRYEDTMRSVNQATTQFADNLVQGLLKGGDAMATLTAGLGALGSSLTSIGTKNLTDGLSGMLKGLGTSGFDPVSLGIGAAGMGISLISSLIGGDDKKRKELEAAQAEWKKAGPAFDLFLSQMSGGVQGNMAKAIEQARQSMQSFADQADRAHDYAAVARAQNAYNEYQISLANKFRATFAATVQGLNDGLGPNSPFLSAVETVKSQLETVQGFLDDVRNANRIGWGSSDANAADAAAKSYLASLLASPPVLSEVATRMLAIQGTAAALQGALVQLGMSSGDAAAAIKAGVDKAINELKTSFESGLTSRLNTANGVGYLNDAQNLIKQHQQDLTDAALTGADMSLVSAVFQAEAQKIVNDAGLVGDAFTNFTKQFPDLASVVTEASADVAAAVKQQQDALNASAKSIVDYVNGLTTGTQSTLSPGDRLNAAQSVYNATLAMAQTGNADAQGRITTDAEALRSAARDMYGSTIGYQTILDGIKNQLLALPSVQQTNDPVVQALRDVLLAVQATTGAVSTLQSSLVGALAANSPSAIAGAFLSSGAVGLTFDQFKAGFPAGLATDSTLAGLYGALDTNKNGIVSQLELLQAALKPAIDSGNAATIASALSTYFNVIATNTDAGITLSDMNVALAGMASVGALRDMFTRLDTDNSGAITKLELIKSASETTASLSGNINTNTANTDARVDQGNAKTNTTNDWLDQIRALNATSATQLTLLQTALAPTSVTGILIPGGVKGGSGLATASVQNQLVEALNKIVWNTYAIANNTAVSQISQNNMTGLLASGGWITGGIPGKDSVPLNGGRALGMPGEFVITRDIAQANKDWLPDFNAGRGIPIPSIQAPSFRGSNDNGGSSKEIISELRRGNKELVDRISKLEGRLAGATIESGRFVREGIDEGNALQADTNKRARRG